MKSTWITYLAVLTLLILMGVVALNLFLFLRPPKQQPVIESNDVRGMAVKHGGLLYTLNFAKQNGIVQALNEPRESKAPLKADFTRLIIYRFTEKELIYSVDELARNVPLLNILSTAYDTYAETAANPKYYSD